MRNVNELTITEIGFKQLNHLNEIKRHFPAHDINIIMAEGQRIGLEAVQYGMQNFHLLPNLITFNLYALNLKRYAEQEELTAELVVLLKQAVEKYPAIAKDVQGYAEGVALLSHLSTAIEKFVEKNLKQQFIAWWNLDKPVSELVAEAPEYLAMSEIEARSCKSTQAALAAHAELMGQLDEDGVDIGQIQNALAQMSKTTEMTEGNVDIGKATFSMTKEIISVLFDEMEVFDELEELGVNKKEFKALLLDLVEAMTLNPDKKPLKDHLAAAIEKYADDLSRLFGDDATLDEALAEEGITKEEWIQIFLTSLAEQISQATGMQFNEADYSKEESLMDWVINKNIDSLYCDEAAPKAMTTQYFTGLRDSSSDSSSESDSDCEQEVKQSHSKRNSPSA